MENITTTATSRVTDIPSFAFGSGMSTAATSLRGDLMGAQRCIDLGTAGSVIRTREDVVKGHVAFPATYVPGPHAWSPPI
ncbi:MAG: hypothetical protein CMH83_16515 [Nocardioides sp.]|nr:hypothetical protein [Nocardioides sp.]